MNDIDVTWNGMILSPIGLFHHDLIFYTGTLKAKIAKLKSELINGPGGKSAGSKDAGRGFEGV
jgi:hypothetical protein